MVSAWERSILSSPPALQSLIEVRPGVLALTRVAADDQSIDGSAGKTGGETAILSPEIPLNNRTISLGCFLFGKKKKAKEQPAEGMPTQEYDRFMSRVYRMVSCHRDSDAIYLLMDQYDYLQIRTQDFETLYQHVEQWGPSRTLLCLGRLIIYKLDREKRHDRVLTYIEKCQNINPQFLLPELSRVPFYARQAIEIGRLDIAKNLVVEHETRYGDLVGSGQCERLLNLIEPDIDVSAIIE